MSYRRHSWWASPRPFAAQNKTGSHFLPSTRTGPVRPPSAASQVSCTTGSGAGCCRCSTRWDQLCKSPTVSRGGRSACVIKYLIRFKRQHSDNRISTYLTPTAKAFYANPQPPLADALATWSLTMGYLWDQGALKYPLVTLRSSINSVVWSCELTLPQAGNAPVALVRQSADLPELDFGRAEEQAGTPNDHEQHHR